MWWYTASVFLGSFLTPIWSNISIASSFFYAKSLLISSRTILNSSSVRRSSFLWMFLRHAAGSSMLRRFGAMAHQKWSKLERRRSCYDSGTPGLMTEGFFFQTCLSFFVGILCQRRTPRGVSALVRTLSRVCHKMLGFMAKRCMIADDLGENLEPLAIRHLLWQTTMCLIDSKIFKNKSSTNGTCLVLSPSPSQGVQQSWHEITMSIGEILWKSTIFAYELHMVWVAQLAKPKPTTVQSPVSLRNHGRDA